MFRIYTGLYEHNLLGLLVNLDPAAFQPVFHFQAHTALVQTMACARRYLVSGAGDEHIRIYDLQKRKELGTLLEHTGTITLLVFALGGKWLVSGLEDGRLVIWRTKDWEKFGSLKGHTARVNDVAIHPSGRVAISVSDDATVRLWNLMTAKKAAVLKLKGRDTLGQKGERVRWSLDGLRFVVGLQKALMVYGTETVTLEKKVELASPLLLMEVFEVDGAEYVVVGLGSGAIQWYTWEALTSEEPKPAFVFQGHTSRVKGLALHKGYLVSVGSDGRIVVWDVAARDQVAVYDTGERLNCVECSDEDVERGIKREAVVMEEETDGEEEAVREEVRKERKRQRKGKKDAVKVTLE